MLSMPIQLRENPYKGVNPHLQSWLQTPGTQSHPSPWQGFHANHISHIADFLNDKLPLGYVAHPEQSLQIRAEDFGSPAEITRRIPDVTVYERQGRTGTEAPAAVADPDARIITLEETLDVTEDFVTAVVIRQVTTDDRFGTVVTRIELLSPSNMPGHTAYESYRINRSEALYSETPLIEIDYLHELPPPLLKVPIYPSQPDSYPYNIYISDPRPSVPEGHLIHYRFSVDEPFKIVTIPLAGEETLDFDFGAVYHHTFARGRWGVYLDYDQLPLRFESYSPADQERITAKAAQLRSAS
jgi:hypothetical protein